MDRSGFFYRRFREHFPYEITSDQDRLFSDVASFLTSDDSDILVVNGYAGTGKTTAISAVIEAMDDLRPVRDGEPEEICICLKSYTIIKCIKFTSHELFSCDIS